MLQPQEKNTPLKDIYTAKLSQELTSASDRTNTLINFQNYLLTTIKSAIAPVEYHNKIAYLLYI
jgi:hypothetical protein